MGAVLEEKFLPGGMQTDIEETDLAYSHQEVRNFRLIKKNVWKNVTPYKEILIGYSDVRAAIEVTDDISDNRFILFQDGTNLKRIDASGGSYTGQTATTLSLPAGVTIGASDTLEFNYFNGVTRISGGSAPLWYGYVQRTILKDAWEEIEKDDYTTSYSLTAFKTSEDATAVKTVSSNAVLEGVLLKVTQTSPQGSVKESFDLEAGATYRVGLCVNRRSAGGGDALLRIGSTEDGSDLGSQSKSDLDQWLFFDIEFTAADTTWIEFLPSDSAGSNATAWIDYFWLERRADIEIDEWVLDEAEPEKLDIYTPASSFDWRLRSEAPESRHFFYGRSFCKYDGLQYSLPISMKKDSADEDFLYQTELLKGAMAKLEATLEGTDLRSNFPNKRLTNIGFSGAYEPDDLGEDYDQNTWYLIEDRDLTEEKDWPAYAPANWYYNDSYKNRIYFNKDSIHASDDYSVWGDYLIRPGMRLILNSYNCNDLEVVVTDVGYTGGPIFYFYYFEINVDLEDAGLLNPEGSGSHYITGQGNDYEFGTDNAVSVKVEPKIVYSSTNGYTFYFVGNPSELVTELYSYIDMPGNASDVFMNYVQIAIANNRSMAIKKDPDFEEEDNVRYSPLGQYDVLPIANSIPNQTGDTDSNRALVSRDDRVVIMKRKTVSQISYSGTSYNQDIGIGGQGLYASYGYYVDQDILWFMDNDDVYLFTGMRPQKFLQNARIRSYYTENITTNGFILYDHNNQELLMYLGSNKFLVFQKEYKSFYIRELDFTPINGFLDADNDLIVFGATKFVNMNNNDSSGDEQVQGYIKTKVYNAGRSDRWSKLSDLTLIASGNGSLELTFSNNQGTGSRSDTVELTTTRSERIARINYLAQEAYVEIQTDSRNDLDVEINPSLVSMEVFSDE